jgi:hypothetical protein
MRYQLRSLVRLPLYFGAHFSPFRPIPCSTRYVIQLVLHSLTMLRPYRSGNGTSLFTQWTNPRYSVLTVRLPVSVRERRCSAMTDICPQCTQSETVPPCTSTSPVQLGATIHHSATETPYRHIHCSRPPLYHCTGHPELVSDLRHERTRHSQV